MLKLSEFKLQSFGLRYLFGHRGVSRLGSSLFVYYWFEFFEPVSNLLDPAIDVHVEDSTPVFALDLKSNCYTRQIAHQVTVVGNLFQDEQF